MWTAETKWQRISESCQPGAVYITLFFAATLHKPWMTELNPSDSHVEISKGQMVSPSEMYSCEYLEFNDILQ